MIWLLACVDAPAPDSAPQGLVWTDPDVTPLSDALLIRRLSLDLRGELPSVEELEADPDALRTEMLADPRFEQRPVDVFAERWGMRTEEFYITPDSIGVPDEQHQAWLSGVGEEPLRLAAWLAARDRPWGEVFTADSTMSTDVLVERWPVEAADDLDPSSDPDWFPARYSDGRPALGVLGTNGFLWRHLQASYGRSRSAAIADLFLCEDFLERPVRFAGSSLAELEDIDEAIQTVEACTNCHAALDPMASALFGFEPFEAYSIRDQGWYHPERERLGIDYLGVHPGFYGTPLERVEDLGLAIARDPRTGRCVVEQLTSALWDREIELSDRPAIDALSEGFDTSGQRIPPLLEAITDSAEYRAGALLDVAHAHVATRRQMSPQQLASSVEQLTGFRWELEGWRQLHNDERGYRVMAGGLQPPHVMSRARLPGGVSDLVLQRLAQGAGQHAVASGAFAMPGSGESGFEDAVTALHVRAHSIEPDADELAAALALFEAVESEEDADAAWASLISVVLRDPAYWTY